MDFATWYTAMCNKKNESASAAAVAIGCTEASGCYWANGERIPRKTTLLRLEEHFGEQYINEKSTAPDGAALHTNSNYDKLSDANKEIIDDLIAKLLKSQSDD